LSIELIYLSCGKDGPTPNQGAGIIMEGWPKGVGPSTTLAWPGWQQPDIPVEVDTAQLKTSRTDTLKELPGYPVQNCLSGSFLFEGGLSAAGE
jgi:hypothetical protein